MQFLVKYISYYWKCRYCQSLHQGHNHPSDHICISALVSHHLLYYKSLMISINRIISSSYTVWLIFHFTFHVSSQVNAPHTDQTHTGSRPTSASCSEAVRESQPPKEVTVGEGSAWGTVTSAGGRLVVAEYGVVLTIPSDALPADGHQQFYVTVDSCAGDTPTLTDRQVYPLSNIMFIIITIIIIMAIFLCCSLEYVHHQTRPQHSFPFLRVPHIPECNFLFSFL